MEKGREKCPRLTEPFVSVCRCRSHQRHCRSSRKTSNPYDGHLCRNQPVLSITFAWTGRCSIHSTSSPFDFFASGINTDLSQQAQSSKGLGTCTAMAWLKSSYSDKLQVWQPWLIVCQLGLPHRDESVLNTRQGAVFNERQGAV